MAENSSGTPKHGSHFAGNTPKRTTTPSRVARHSGAAAGKLPAQPNEDLPVADVPTISASDAGASMRGAGAISNRTAQATRSASGGHRSHGSRARGAQATLGVDVPYRQKKARRFTWVGPVVTLLLFVGLGFVTYRYVWPRLFGTEERASGGSIAAGQQVTVTIAEGSGAAEIAYKLEEAGVIDDASAFAQQLLKEGADSQLKPGTYNFVTGSNNYRNIIDLLVSGPNANMYTFTVPEGSTISVTASKVEESLGISADEFLAQAKASTYVADYPFLEEAAASEYDSLEGYLFPKTYILDGQDITADNAIRAMLNQYQSEMANFDVPAAQASIEGTYGITLSDYDLIKIASIIEKEAITDEQRPLVSSVIMNRLRNGKYLESDATIAYITGGTDAASDRSVDSPYNSYENGGLPPTPICSPSVDALRAALAPENTDYLYFWILENGEEHFSTTYEEHQNTYNQAISG